MCNYYDKHCQEIGQLYKNFSEQRLCLLKNRERKLTFIECLVSVIVLSTFSCEFSQLFRCLWSHYHRGPSSLLPEYVSSLFPSNFCLCVSSLFTSLSVSDFIFLNLSFFLVLFLVCQISYSNLLLYDILYHYVPVWYFDNVSSCHWLLSFLRYNIRGHMLSSFGHYLRAVRDSFKKSRHVKMSCYCIGTGYYLLLKFRFSLNFSLKFSIFLVVISLLVSL